MSNKAYLEFEGFNEAIARLNKLNANTKNISEKSLKKTHEIITKKAQEAITPHNETKRTEKAYGINSNMTFGYKRYFDEDKNKWITKGLVILDGKPLNTNYIYLLKKSVKG